MQTMNVTFYYVFMYQTNHVAASRQIAYCMAWMSKKE